MTVYFVTRHRGARDWAQTEGIGPVTLLEHLDPDTLAQGDVVLGTLPIQLVAAANARGARYLHLVLDVPPDRRGTEITADDMRTFGARLEEYRAERVGTRLQQEPTTSGQEDR